MDFWAVGQMLAVKIGIIHVVEHFLNNPHGVDVRLTLHKIKSTHIYRCP